MRIIPACADRLFKFVPVDLGFKYAVNQPVSNLNNFGFDQAKNEEIALLFGGDVMLGRYVNVLSLEKKDYTWLFKDIKIETSKADVFQVNLESPIIKNCPQTSTGFKFCADSSSVGGLVFAQISAVNLANNHSLNYGKIGFDETQQIIKSAGIGVFAGEEIYYKTVKNTKLAFIGFNDVGVGGKNIFGADTDSIAKLVSSALLKADVVIVNFHFGGEYTDTVTQRQKLLAHTAIDSGATLVIGAHPHWVQMYEKYKDGIIFYSLGNLVFDQMWSERTREGVLAKVIIQNKKIKSFELINTKIYDYGRVVLAD